MSPWRGLRRLLEHPRTTFAAASVVIVIAAVFGLASWRYRTILLDEARARTARLSLLLAEQTARTFEAVDFTLRGFEPLLDPPLGAQGFANMDALLARRVRELSFVRSIRILENGELWLSSTDANDYVEADRDLASRLIGDAKTDLLIGNNTGRVKAPLIAFARQMLGTNGSRSAILVADVDPNYFARFFNGLGLGPGGVVTLSENREAALEDRTTGANANLKPSEILVSSDRLATVSQWQAATADQISTTRPTEGYPLSVRVSIDRRDVDRQWLSAVVLAFAAVVALAPC